MLIGKAKLLDQYIEDADEYFIKPAFPLNSPPIFVGGRAVMHEIKKRINVEDVMATMGVEHVGEPEIKTTIPDRPETRCIILLAQPVEICIDVIKESAIALDVILRSTD